MKKILLLLLNAERKFDVIGITVFMITCSLLWLFVVPAAGDVTESYEWHHKSFHAPIFISSFSGILVAVCALLGAFVLYYKTNELRGYYLFIASGVLALFPFTGDTHYGQYSGTYAIHSLQLQYIMGWVLFVWMLGKACLTLWNGRDDRATD